MTDGIEKTKDDVEPRINAEMSERIIPDQKRGLVSALIRVYPVLFAALISAAKTAFLLVPKCIRMHPHASWCFLKTELNDQSHRVQRARHSPEFPKIPQPRRSSRRKHRRAG